MPSDLLSAAAPSPARPVPAGALDGAFEHLHVRHDAATGLLALICIDSTVLGPGDGGVRMRPYDTFEDAVADVTRLARAMTMKFAAAGEDRGGAKAVIIGDPRVDKSDALLRSFGRFVASLGGAYWAGEDAGLTLADMAVIGSETSYVSTLPVAAGGAGDIAPATAAGVVHAMRACVARVWGTEDLRGRTVAVQGLGACGANAVDLLVAAGADLVVTDVDAARVRLVLDRHAGAPVRAVAPDAILDQEVDVFAPFAFGGVIDAGALDRLRVQVIAGSANNVMVDEAIERKVVERGIVYAVDFIANAGGAIMDADHLRPGGIDPQRVARKLAAIGPRITGVLDLADHEGILPSEAASRLANERLAAAAGAGGRPSVTLTI